jgi:hypothetical protein
MLKTIKNFIKLTAKLNYLVFQNHDDREGSILSDTKPQRFISTKEIMKI